MRSKITPADGDPRHGTTNGYRHLGCRCLRCSEAARADMERYRRRKGVKQRPEATCGTHAGYTQHRRESTPVCAECKWAEVDYQAERRRSRSTADAPHGTANGYNNYGCRCEWCRQAWSVYLREWRRERKAKAS